MHAQLRSYPYPHPHLISFQFPNISAPDNAGVKLVFHTREALGNAVRAGAREGVPRCYAKVNQGNVYQRAYERLCRMHFVCAFQSEIIDVWKRIRLRYDGTTQKCTYPHPSKSTTATQTHTHLIA